MDSLMQNSAYFGFFITLMGYWCAVQVEDTKIIRKSKV